MTGWRELSRLGAGLSASLQNAGGIGQRQTAWLNACLTRNASTEYGRRYGFATIRSPEQYREQVPLATYDDMVPWIERCSQGAPDMLFAGSAVAFERTGGSTGGTKLLPYSSHSFEDFRIAILRWLNDIIETYRLSDGCAYWAISPVTRQFETTAGGIPVGVSDAVFLGDEATPAFAALSAVTPKVGSIANVRDWQLLTLHALVRRVDLVLVSVWSPTFFLTLIDAFAVRADELEMLFAKGGCIADNTAEADPAALARFQAYRADQDLRHLWPNLVLVSCWADGASAPYCELLRERLPHAAFQGKGLLATEGVITVPDTTGRPVLAADSGFFEFVDSSGNCMIGSDLRAGERYEVVMTTSGGLYRYRIGDIVECEKSGSGGPVLRFTGRVGRASDLVGEKLSEEFVATCLASLRGFRLLVQSEGAIPGYALILDQRYAGDTEQLARSIDERLQSNPQYAYARRIGQLDRLKVYCVDDPVNTYIRHAMGTHARMGDVKIPVLRHEPGWLSIFLGRAA